MSGHLTNEQITNYLAGDESARFAAHINECEQCRVEKARLFELIAASRSFTESASIQDATFWARQRNRTIDATRQRRAAGPQWALAAALAMLVLISVFMFRSQEQQHLATNKPAAEVQMSDEALLSAVNSTLEQDVPAALAPVQMLAYQRQAAEESRAARN